MIRRLSQSLIAGTVFLCLASCNGEKRSSTPDTARTTNGDSSASPDAQAPKSMTVVGKVVKKPWSKSLESWHAGGGDYFVVETDSGKSLILRPSHKVSLYDLNTAVGKKVRVTGTEVPYKPYEPVHPGEQYPMGPDGKPMARGGGIRALKLDVIP